MGRDPDGHYNNSTDVRVAVNCVDEPPVDRPGQGRRKGPPRPRGGTVHELRRVHRVRAARHLCVLARCPRPRRRTRLSVQGLPPILVVSTTNDPATPYQAGVDLAKQLGGALLTFEGTQHTVVFQGIAASTTSRPAISSTWPYRRPAPSADRPPDRWSPSSHRLIAPCLRSGPRVRNRRPLRANMFAMWRAAAEVDAARHHLHSLVVSTSSGPVASASPAWGSCSSFFGDVNSIPTARCGTVSVPVDYANPEGPQAQLAVIRVPATGDRIGVLMVNPGGPGASAVDIVAGMGADPGPYRHHPPLRPGRLRSARRRAFDAAGALPHRRRVRRLSTRSDDRLQPGGRRAHRGALPADRAGLRRQDGPRLPGQRRDGVGRRRTWTSCGQRWGRTRSTTSASPTAPSSALPTPSGTPTACAPWCSTAPSTPLRSHR